VPSDSDPNCNNHNYAQARLTKMAIADPRADRALKEGVHSKKRPVEAFANGAQQTDSCLPNPRVSGDKKLGIYLTPNRVCAAEAAAPQPMSHRPCTSVPLQNSLRMCCQSTCDQPHNTLVRSTAVLGKTAQIYRWRYGSQVC